MSERTFKTENGQVVDDRGNKANIWYWGSEEKARASLETLSDCYGCSDCSDCSDCYDCFDCSRCSRCSGLCFAQGKKDEKAEGSESPIREVPKIENIHVAIYEAVTREGCSLDMGNWHVCDTTHCRAGWVVHLAGEAGYALEKQTSTLFAAMQIYKASGHLINPGRFYDSNEDALADMAKLAGVKA